MSKNPYGPADPPPKKDPMPAESFFVVVFVLTAILILVARLLFLS